MTLDCKLYVCLLRLYLSYLSGDNEWSDVCHCSIGVKLAMSRYSTVDSIMCWFCLSVCFLAFHITALFELGKNNPIQIVIWFDG